MTFIVCTCAWIIIQEYIQTFSIYRLHIVFNYFSKREKKILWQAQSWREYLKSIIHIDDRGV